jgi:hypothetical protein
MTFLPLWYVPLAIEESEPEIKLFAYIQISGSLMRLDGRISLRKMCCLKFYDFLRNFQ